MCEGRRCARAAAARVHALLRRRPPAQVVGNPGLAKAVDEYWQRKRTERVQSGELPDLEAISKLAEAEHQQKGGDFDAIVQRLWADAKRSLSERSALAASAAVAVPAAARAAAADLGISIPASERPLA